MLNYLCHAQITACPSNVAAACANNTCVITNSGGGSYTDGSDTGAIILSVLLIGAVALVVVCVAVVVLVIIVSAVLMSLKCMCPTIMSLVFITFLTHTVNYHPPQPQGVHFSSVRTNTTSNKDPLHLTLNIAYPFHNHTHPPEREQEPPRPQEGGLVTSSSEGNNAELGGDRTNGAHSTDDIQLQPNPVYTIHNESPPHRDNPPPAAESISLTHCVAKPPHTGDYLQLLPNNPSNDSNAQSPPQPHEREHGSQCVPPASDEDDGEEEVVAVYYI